MLINLVLKDFILIKKDLLFFMAFAIVAPIYLASQMMASSISFFIVVLFIAYLSYNHVMTDEYKYKGTSLLCATPYMRKSVVLAKYLDVFFIFMLCALIQMMTATVVPMYMERLSVSGFSVSLLFFSLFFAILIPVQYKFGYEKTRRIFLVIIFCTPFALGYLMKGLRTHPIHFSYALSFPAMIQHWIPALVGVLITLLSIMLSLRIFARKDL
ncbi:ABC-2 transporter permease [Sporolactobacillus terrae]|uniref:ABC transporter permease n=1 Tax=Sporolactobacillus terrae TaxID=269673 RepID=A0A5K7WZL4_9BACL|nr:ABC-2 transporter permease [Sporolactobacillus terrae]BBN99732.1 ABC transporter permease [Sporolactobacillus terrae]